MTIALSASALYDTGTSMFDRLEIRNFKSIEHLDIECRRVNILIGEPNTGKSNILETLGLISYFAHSNEVNDFNGFVRCDDTSNLFYDGDLSRLLEITLTRDSPVGGEYRIQETDCLQLRYSDGQFKGGIEREALARDLNSNQINSNRYQTLSIAGDHRALLSGPISDRGRSVDSCKFYRFAPLSSFPEKGGRFLLPPSGANLLFLLLQNRDLRVDANRPFLSRGLRLGLRPQENKIEVLKDFDDVIVSHPYHLASDTFQRLVFYMAALHTNSDSVLVFEEPEAHAFPYYTKYLAERIALDERGNQYFISTHNPYFLLPILEKTLSEDIAVFITYYDDYRTKVRQLSPDELSRISDDIDVFSNIQMFLED